MWGIRKQSSWDESDNGNSSGLEDDPREVERAVFGEL